MYVKNEHFFGVNFCKKLQLLSLSNSIATIFENFTPVRLILKPKTGCAEKCLFWKNIKNPKFIATIFENFTPVRLIVKPKTVCAEKLIKALI